MIWPQSVRHGLTFISNGRLVLDVTFHMALSISYPRSIDTFYLLGNSHLFHLGLKLWLRYDS
jgi:hypothetical protein